MKYFTCRQNIRTAGNGYEPDLLDVAPTHDRPPEPDPFTDWLDADQLTILDHPHITAAGTIGCPLFDHEETGEVSHA